MSAHPVMTVRLLEPQPDGGLLIATRTYLWEQPYYVGASGPPMVIETLQPVTERPEGEAFIDPRTLKTIHVGPV